MRPTFALVIPLVAVVALAFLGGPVGAEEGPGSTAAEDETTSVIVALRDLDIPGDAPVLAGSLELDHEGVATTAVLEHLDLMAAEVTPAGLTALRADPAVVSVRPARDDLRLLLDVSTVTVGAAALHLDGFTGEGRTVAVIDSGVDRDHPGLMDDGISSVVEEGCILVGVPDPDPESTLPTELCENGTRSGPSAEPCTAVPDVCTHGTAVAGVISGDDATYTGVAPDAGIIALRVTAILDGTDYIAEAAVLAALERVYELRTTYDIAAVNLSLGGDPGTCQDAAWEDVVGRLNDAGIAVVAASGNSGWKNTLSFPACLPDVISVGATTPSGTVASFTSSSADLDLLAPGSPVETTVLDIYDSSGFAPVQGTSFSAPHVAGAFALIDSALPSAWPVSRARNLMRASGEMIVRPTPSGSDHDPRFPELRLESLVDFEPFGDAGSGYWVEAADWAKVTGVSTGIGGNTFGPELPLTRAQAVTFLWRFMGEPDHGTDSGFDDVDPAIWYARAVAWAAAVGVTTGTSPTQFSPDDVVTRAQLATFLWRTAGQPAPSLGSGFADVSPGDYFAVAVDWMAEHEITTGTSPTTFSPYDEVSRAQMVTFEHRLADADFAWTGSVAPPELALF